VAGTTCSASGGEPAPAVRSFDVSLHRGENPEAVAFWRHEFPNGSPEVAGTWKVTADKGLYSMHFEVRTVAGHRSFQRAVQIDDNSTITVDIERDLTGPDGGRR
jgi:hypothetical protein